MKKIVKWFFGSVNGGRGIQMIEGRSYKLKTSTGNVWGRFVRRISKQSVVLLDRKGEERSAALDHNTTVYTIKGKAKKK